MLLIFSVLFVAASALAAPPQQVRLNLIQQGDSRGKDSTVLGTAFDKIIDRGETGPVTLVLGQVLRDLSRTSYSALANGQGIIALGELATGRPGDSCAASNLVNTYVNRVQSGNIGNLRNALNNYIQNVNSKIDDVVRLATNKESARVATGSQSGCPNEGRVYQFEAAWDSVLGSATGSQLSLINEEYCASKRLYCSLSARGNNLAAQVTASALPVTQEVFKLAARPLANLVQVLANGGNPGQAAGSLKKALSQAASRIEL